MELTSSTKVVMWGTIGQELIAVVYDLRYMVFFSIALILADLWWGHSDTMKRYHEAVDSGDKILMEKFKWKKSRAGRRTANKVVDYLTYLIVGALLGLAITEPMGWCDHIWTAAAGLGLGCTCELASIAGHVIYVKLGIEVSIKDAWKFIWRFIAKFFKAKGNAIGEAVDEMCNEK